MSDPEASEADALEQDQTVDPPIAPDLPDNGAEIPEADAFEQAQPAPIDPDDYR